MATALGLEAADLDLEGTCLVGDRLRWFQRGYGRSRLPSASVDLDAGAVVAAAAEDAPDAVTDGPGVGSALAVVDEDESVAAVAPVEADGPAWRIEGLALRGQSADGAVSVLAVTDQDDARVSSLAVELTLRW